MKLAFPSLADKFLFESMQNPTEKISEFQLAHEIISSWQENYGIQENIIDWCNGTMQHFGMIIVKE